MEIKYQTLAVVRFQKQGFHRWIDATDDRLYLENRHRHLFHVEVKLELFGDDREVEFHDLLDFCQENFPGGELGEQSCEQMAIALAANIRERWSGRAIVVGVYEDGEVGAQIRIC